MTVVSKGQQAQPVTKKAKGKTKDSDPSFMDQTMEYFKGVRSEWHKVTWPDKQQIWHETLIVIAVTTFITLLIFLIDLILRTLIGFIPT